MEGQGQQGKSLYSSGMEYEKVWKQELSLVQYV